MCVEAFDGGLGVYFAVILAEIGAVASVFAAGCGVGVAISHTRWITFMSSPQGMSQVLSGEGTQTTP
jgi:hypothetical protein